MISIVATYLGCGTCAVVVRPNIGCSAVSVIVCVNAAVLVTTNGTGSLCSTGCSAAGTSVVRPFTVSIIPITIFYCKQLIISNKVKILCLVPLIIPVVSTGGTIHTAEDYTLVILVGKSSLIQSSGTNGFHAHPSVIAITIEKIHSKTCSICLPIAIGLKVDCLAERTSRTLAILESVTYLTTGGFRPRSAIPTTNSIEVMSTIKYKVSGLIPPIIPVVSTGRTIHTAEDNVLMISRRNSYFINVIAYTIHIYPCGS